jgi:hypothetical protein
MKKFAPSVLCGSPDSASQSWYGSDVDGGLAAFIQSSSNSFSEFGPFFWMNWFLYRAASDAGGNGELPSFPIELFMLIHRGVVVPAKARVKAGKARV